MSPVAYLQSIGFWGPAHGRQPRRVGGCGRHQAASQSPGGGVAQPGKQHEAGKRHRARAGIPRRRRHGGARDRRRGQQQRSGHVRGNAIRGAAAQSEDRGSANTPRRDGARDGDNSGRQGVGLEKQIGSLEAGKRGDLAVVSMSSARLTPIYDPVSHLVYAARGDDVRTVLVNGRVLMRDRQMLTLDEPAVLAEARKFAQAVRAAVGK